ncbi:hypothetical protein G5B38_21860 (plasmid) [Pseudohalocynthiibacter aestuariivivens]|nr:hypothetical protein [Pseudohalocynthiibacter aestuariivivens]QIE48251.1 hypothetical protein G5B38_21860 [Pseudohalocynthiibacter aestuariivivens]
MDRIFLTLIVLVLGAIVATLAINMRRAAQARSGTRAAFLDICRSLLDRPRTQIAATGYARLAGKYAGLEADIQVVPDTLTFRKLPALWVLVTLPGPLPVGATVDLMIRPTGVEPFSRFQTLNTQLDVPDGFPEDCAIRTDCQADMPSEALVRAHLHLFDDPMVKELVISPKGVRLVFLAEEAQRSRYLIYRDCEMGQTPLPAERLAPKLDALLALRADVLDEGAPQLQSKSA